MDKYQVYATIDYAGFWIRLVAFLIDVIILGAVYWVFNGIWRLTSGVGWMGKSATDPFTEATGASSILGLLVLLLIILVYLVGFWGWRGQTPGKMVLRLKITHLDGSDIGWGAVILRLLGYVPSLVFLCIGFIWIGFEIHRQGLHDKIADTSVIRLPRK